jgi:ribosome biogenesis GTPase A
MGGNVEHWRQLASTFRKTFYFPSNARHSWFPGHMYRGMKQMQRALARTDCIVEVHDARIPLSGRNKNFRCDNQY